MQNEYVALCGPTGRKYGAEVIVGKGRIDTREGQNIPRQLVIRFQSYDDAINCYEDPDYIKAMELASRAFDRELSILEG